jgi:hypothetical protein
VSSKNGVGARDNRLGQNPGDQDEDPNVVWFARECQSNHVPFEPLLGLAERARDHEMAAFFRHAQEVGQRLSVAV